MLKPFLAFLTRFGILANHLTSVSAVVSILFIPIFTVSYNWGVVMLILHVLLDTLDGPLARFQKSSSNRGMLSDFLADLIGICATTIGLVLTNYVWTVWGFVYLFLYVIVSFFALLQSVLGLEQPWALRPRFFVYGAVIGMPIVEWATGFHIDLISTFMVIGSVFMLIVMIRDFYRLGDHANL